MGNKLKIGIVCYPTYGGSGVVATELGIALAEKGNEVHFISYDQPFRLDLYSERIKYDLLIERTKTVKTNIKHGNKK